MLKILGHRIYQFLSMRVFMYSFLACCFLIIFMLYIIGNHIDYDIEKLEEGSLEQRLKIFLINNASSGVTKPARYINETILKEKIAQGLPQWAADQIQKDLSKFESINKEQLMQFFDTHKNTKPGAWLVLVQIKNGKVKLIGPESYGHTKVIINRDAREIYSDVLQFLANNNYIPDSDFLLWTSDFSVIPGKNLIPAFTFAKDMSIPIEKDLILVPDWMNMRSNYHLRAEIKAAIQKFLWPDKLPMVVWRGGGTDSTGFRKKVVTFSKQYPNLVDAEFAYRDWEKFLSPSDQLRYKYLLTIDGSRCAWERFLWQLHSNSVVLKHDSVQIQWFYNALQPFVHYIPVKDEEDILKKISWLEEHPQESYQIIQNASNFANNNLSLEDMCLYIITLLQEYNKKMSNTHNSDIISQQQMLKTSNR